MNEFMHGKCMEPHLASLGVTVAFAVIINSKGPAQRGRRQWEGHQQKQKIRLHFPESFGIFLPPYFFPLRPRVHFCCQVVLDTHWTDSGLFLLTDEEPKSH